MDSPLLLVCDYNASDGLPSGSCLQAAYLARAGKRVAVFEKRHVLGGAAVTEEIVPGFKFSRASYLLSLLRPVIVKDLELKVKGENAQKGKKGSRSTFCLETRA